MILHPYSKEYEMIVLSCMLTNIDSLKMACETLFDADFYYDEHKMIFQILKQAYKKGRFNVSLICEELRKKNKLKYVGDIINMAALSEYEETLTQLKMYCEQLKQLTMKRQLEYLRELLVQDLQKESNVIRIIEKLKKNIKKIESKIEMRSGLSYLLEDHSEEKLIEKLKEVAPGINTGFKIGEEEIQLAAGALTTIAMPRGHGKTTTLINYSLGVLEHQTDKSVYFFTFEDSQAAIQTRFMNTYINKEISSNNREAIKSYFLGKTTQIQESQLDDFLTGKQAFFENLINKGRLKVFYSDMDSEELIAAIHFIKKYTNVGLVCVDYLQLLTSDTAGDLKDICQMLKNCAVETGLPILLGAQFNHTVTSEADLKPTAIRETTDIDQISHLMIGGWNRNFSRINQQNEIYFEIIKAKEMKHGQNSTTKFNSNIGRL